MINISQTRVSVLQGCTQETSQDGAREEVRNLGQIEALYARAVSDMVPALQVERSPALFTPGGVLPLGRTHVLAGPPDAGVSESLRQAFASYDVHVAVKQDGTQYTLELSRPAGQPAALESRARARKIARVRTALQALQALAAEKKITVVVTMDAHSVSLDALRAATLVDHLYDGKEDSGASDAGTVGDSSGAGAEQTDSIELWQQFALNEIKSLNEMIEVRAGVLKLSDPNQPSLVGRIDFDAASAARKLLTSKSALLKLRGMIVDSVLKIAAHQQTIEEKGTLLLTTTDLRQTLRDLSSIGENNINVDMLLHSVVYDALKSQGAVRKVPKGVGKFDFWDWKGYCDEIFRTLAIQEVIPSDLGSVRISVGMTAKGDWPGIWIYLDAPKDEQKAQAALKKLLTPEFIEKLSGGLAKVRSFERFVSARKRSKLRFGYHKPAGEEGKEEYVNLLTLRNNSKVERRLLKHAKKK